jgi:hypothetical protein
MKRQTCKVCRSPDKFDFHVPDEVWKRVVPEEYRNRVVCLPCFDDLALLNGVDYCDSVQALYFVGAKAVFRFQTVSAQSGG